MTPDLDRTLYGAVDALEVLKVRYALVGGMAMNAWVIPRSTRDVDLYAELSPSVRPSLLRELEARRFHVPAMEEELRQFGVFRSRSDDGVFLDIFDSQGPLGQAILDRRRQIAVAGRTIWIIAPEDLAVLKAFSDRPRDFDDLAKLVAGPLDLSYVESWARRLDESIGTDEVSGRLRRALGALSRR